MTITELGAITEANGLRLSDEKLVKLGEYAELLCAKNKIVNLISRKDEENIISKHILHSLTLILPHISLGGIHNEAKVFDLGTGGGLPGIPIGIARPDISITLCDSIGKKIAAVKEMTNALGLSHIVSVTDRAENLANNKAHKHQYDFVITRAVAPLDELLKWSHSLVKKNGTLLSLKGGNLDDEKKNAKKVNFATNIDEEILSLEGFDEFAKEEKKIVRVRLA
jgi:16S rRNA (guanine527-N7)-methyltransferase